MIILDTNPFAWDELSSVLTLKQTVANLVIFVNSHLAINHANKVAIIASHPDRASYMHPVARLKSLNSATKTKTGHADSDVNMADTDIETPDVTDAANKYRPFAVVERELLASLSELFASTDADILADDGNNTMIAGSLTMALAHISKMGMAYWPTSDSVIDCHNGNRNGMENGMAPSANEADLSDGTNFTTKAALTARILIVSVSGDLAGQYIPVMNAVFAAQRLRIPIDVLKLAGDTAFLQQASDATGGIYIAPHTPQGMLQYLMMAFLPDQIARQWLVPAVESAVDFRAACFCHRNVITTGFVCSVCLSSEFVPGLELLSPTLSFMVSLLISYVMNSHSFLQTAS